MIPGRVFLCLPLICYFGKKDVSSFSKLFYRLHWGVSQPLINSLSFFSFLISSPNPFLDNIISDHPILYDPLVGIPHCSQDRILAFYQYIMIVPIVCFLSKSN